ncbi:hypothetical protein LRS03_02060 [Rhizobacter sp. J219]|uniref:hypothetical protein n=1 Tax=Rhizobacter sp. J219 TaxID=2898430 RepID=UPI002151212F|nr:hypothetical protein [Rhizobacter sp. J219]MCR5881707.1 hypothetical protein [Rhizobacter sp. J219]
MEPPWWTVMAVVVAGIALNGAGTTVKSYGNGTGERGYCLRHCESAHSWTWNVPWWRPSASDGEV